MINQEERLTKQQKIFEGFKTSLPWLTSQGKNLRIRRQNRYQTEKIPSAETPPPAAPTEFQTIVPSALPSLEEIVSSQGSPAPYTLLLGLCDDGVPLSMNLSNPAPGSLLLSGDSQSGKTHLLRAMLSSIAMLNPADQVLYFILAPDRHEYTDISELDNCRKLTCHEEQAAARLLQELYDETEKRRSTPSSLMMVLAIDELAKFIKATGKSHLDQLLRLIKHGPRVGIWVVASLAAEDIDQVDPVVIDAFRTRLIGHLSDRVLATYLGRDPECPAGQVEKGRQWLVSVGNEWVPFWICDPHGGVQ